MKRGENKEYLNFLENLVLEIGGQEDLEMLREAHIVAVEISGCLNKLEKVPQGKVDRWNELVRKLMEKE